MRKEGCNHELFCTDEEWISDNEVKVTIECSLCKTKFNGTIKEI